MTSLGKALVVFTTLVSQFFLGLIFVTAYAGRNWQAEAAEMDGYTFSLTPGDIPQWSVTHRVTGQSLSTSPTLPGAIKIALDDKAQRINDQLPGLEQRKQLLEAQLADSTAAAAQDVEGLTKRIQALQADLDSLNESIASLIEEQQTLSSRADQTRRTAERRRSDVARLENILAEIRAERFRIQEQIRRLEDRRVRLQGSLSRAEARNEQLESRLREGYADGI